MRVPLPPDLPYSYSLAAGETVTATVTGANPVDYGLITGDTRTVNRAAPDAQLAPGDTVELDAPGWLISPDGSEVDLAYPGSGEVDIPPPYVPPPE